MNEIEETRADIERLENEKKIADDQLGIALHKQRKIEMELSRAKFRLADLLDMQTATVKPRE